MKIQNILNDNIGFVELQDVLGNDLSIVNAARVSYLGESKGEEQDRKLLNYLWKNKHTSPFEMCSIKVVIKCPLFVRSQIQRHRTFSYNEVSRRYTSEEIEFYFPKEWRLQDNKNKQGSIFGDTENVSNFISPKVKLLTHNAINVYNELLENNIAREQARMVLPQNLYTKFVMFGNLRNWLHFCVLRSDKHAQLETRLYSDVILHKFISKHFPWTYEIFMETNPNLGE